jgi:hypothetical protein
MEMRGHGVWADVYTKKGRVLLAIPLGIVSTLLTWFIYRVEECRDVFSCLQIFDRGFPLAWVAVENYACFCPAIPTGTPSWLFWLYCRCYILRFDWFELAIDLLVWASLFALLLTLVLPRTLGALSKNIRKNPPKPNSHHPTLQGC